MHDAPALELERVRLAPVLVDKDSSVGDADCAPGRLASRLSSQAN